MRIKNKRIAIQNQNRREDEERIRLNSLHPIAAKIINNEKQTKHKLESRTSSEWINLIKQLPKRLHNRVACLVYWDFYGQKTEADCQVFKDIVRKELQQKTYETTNPEEVRVALVQIGYTPFHAFNRGSNR